jgi:hypothetical protein
MDDAFIREQLALLQQLAHIRRMSERMSQVQQGVARNAELIARDREAVHAGPLADVRDVRTAEAGRSAARVEHTRHTPRRARVHTRKGRR